MITLLGPLLLEIQSLEAVLVLERHNKCMLHQALEELTLSSPGQPLSEVGGNCGHMTHNRLSAHRDSIHGVVELNYILHLATSAHHIPITIAG